MSKYSGNQDFKDILDMNFKGFDEFKEHTHNVIYQWDSNNQLKVIFIENPIDLIKYYSCRVASIEKQNYKYIIKLEQPTKIQEWFENTPIGKSGFDEDDINNIIELAKDPSSGFQINDVRLIGAYMIMHRIPEDKRYII